MKLGILQLTAARRDTRKLLAKIAGLRFLLSPPCIAAGFSSSATRLESYVSYVIERDGGDTNLSGLLNFKLSLVDLKGPLRFVEFIPSKTLKIKLRHVYVCL